MKFTTAYAYAAAVTLFASSASAKMGEHRNLHAKVDALESKVDAKVDALESKIAELEALLMGAPRAAPQGNKNLRRSLEGDVAGDLVVVDDATTTEEADAPMSEELGYSDLWQAIEAIRPVKNYICYSDEEIDLEVSLFEPDALITHTSEDFRNDDFNFVNVTEFDGHFDFGKVHVKHNQDILVDLTASTGSLYFSGNIDVDPSTFSELADIVVPQNTNYHYPNWNSVNEASVSIGIELIPSHGGATISPVPQAMVTLSSIEDVFAWDNDDFDTDDASFFQKKEMSTHSAKYLFPHLNAGEYDIKVRVMLDAGAELFDRYDIENQALTKVVLGPHFIKASVLDSEDNGECAAITAITRRE